MANISKMDNRHIIDQSDNTVIHKHFMITLYLEGISRACLQELVRHRLASFSVQSTRYCLGRLKHEEFSFVSKDGRELCDTYLVRTGNEFVDYNNQIQLEEVRQGALAGIPNDTLKMMLPESFKTKLVMTINVRSLRNLLNLRLDKRAHWEIRSLASNIVGVIPEEHQMLIKDITALHKKPEEAQSI